MHHFLRQTILLLALALTAGARTDQLEEKLKAIDAELSRLPLLSLQTSVGAIGFRSDPHSSPNHTEWIQIDLPEESSIDLIAIVPTIWRGSQTEFQDDGFPEEFHLSAGSKDHPEGRIIASFNKDDRLLPRIAPLLIPCNTKASWIKLTATRLGQRAWDSQYILQLSEIMVFQGQENLALRQTVTTSSPKREWEFGARQRRFLVDGSLPYLMNASQGQSTQGCTADFSNGETASLIIDLGEAIPIDRFHFHALDLTDTIPQANRANFATPKHFTLEGAMTSDFSDAHSLCEYRQTSPYDFSPILSFRFPEHHCRFLRLNILEPDRTQPSERNTHSPIFGSAEIQAFSKGVNVLANKVVTSTGLIPSEHRPLANLTDGFNHFGIIPDTRQWVEQLARRHALEAERPLIAAQINDTLEEQNENLARLKTLSLIALAGLTILVLASQIMRMRQIADLRRRFAADLHDEIGANLHAIGLLSDIAREEAEQPTDESSLSETIHEIRATTERTAEAVRYCISAQEGRRSLGSLEQDMHRIARRMLEDLEYDISVGGKEEIENLPLRTRADLFRFYKECLVNISRHSEATHFEARVDASPRQVTMTISDNGQGLPGDAPPASILRRARILRGKVSITSPPPGKETGSQIQLTWRKRRFLFF